MDKEIIINPRAVNPLQEVVVQVARQMSEQLTPQAGTKVNIIMIGHIPATGQFELYGTMPQPDTVTVLKAALEQVTNGAKLGLILP